MSTVSTPASVLATGATAGQPPSPERAKLREAAQAFEAIFVRQMLSSARAADFGGNDLLGKDQGHDTFNQMRDERFAEIASKSGAFGLAKQIEAQLARTLTPQPAAPAAPAATPAKEG